MLLNYDVSIIGGGIAGISCAYICSKLGLKTLLVEKESYLGGDITGSLVIPVMKTETKNLNTSFYKDLIELANKYGAQITYSDSNDGWFNPVILKFVFEDMLKKFNCDILFESKAQFVETKDKLIKKAHIMSKFLSLPIVSKYFVDATGNASFSKLAKCEFWNDTSQKQPPSLRFLISGVDLAKLASFLERVDSDTNVTTTYRIDNIVHLSTAFTWDKTKKWALAPYFEKALKENILQNSDLSYFQLFSVAAMPDTVALNCPRLRDFDYNDPLDYSNAIIDARKAIVRLHKFLVNYIEGFENSYISNIAPKIGDRETLRVKCKYDYTINDIIEHTEFKNPALYSNYPVDIHSNKKDKSVLFKVCSYCLPVESLIVKNYENLFAIGKIAGCDFKSQAALRVQSSCMSMGEAVANYIYLNVN